MDARFSISNMSTEWGPLVGWFPVDGVTIKYLAVSAGAAGGAGHRALHRSMTSSTGRESAAADPDAVYAARIVLDLAQVTPHVSGPDTVK